MKLHEKLEEGLDEASWKLLVLKFFVLQMEIFSVLLLKSL